RAGHHGPHLRPLTGRSGLPHRHRVARSADPVYRSSRAGPQRLERGTLEAGCSEGVLLTGVLAILSVDVGRASPLLGASIGSLQELTSPSVQLLPATFS